MRTTSRFTGFFVASVVCLPAVFAQTNPPPPNPHEMVLREPRTLSKVAERTAALELLDRARENYNLRGITTPYTLKVSFETNGATQSEGEGTMEEASDGGSHWRWMTKLQDSVVIRMGGDGHVYGTNPSEPVPMRVQMVRAALHWPITRYASATVIREANVERDGKAMTCLLLSGSIVEHPAPRAWVENEYCIDTATGSLQTWSEAPGIYAEYDYGGAADFHGHTLPREIAIYEEGQLVVKARVESLEDAHELDANLFKPTAEMVDAGESFTLSSPNRFPMRVDPSDAPTSNFFQPVIVHAILDAQEGRVLDAEVLQNSDRELSREAMVLVRSTSFPPSGFQQEVFINVQFHLPAVEMGGPPIFHTPVVWVIWEHRHRVAPVRKPSHVGN
jgi:hypothetical protein